MMELRTKCLAIAGSMILSFIALPQAQAGHAGVTVTFHGGSVSAGSRPVFSHRGRHGTRHFRHQGFHSTIRFGRRGNFNRRNFNRDRFRFNRDRFGFDRRFDGDRFGRDIAFGRRIERSKFCAGRCQSTRRSIHFGRDIAFGRKIHRSKFCAGKCQSKNKSIRKGSHSGKQSVSGRKKRSFSAG